MRKILTLLPLALLAGACGSGHSYTVGSPTTTSSTSTTIARRAPAAVPSAPGVTSAVVAQSTSNLDSTARAFITAMFDNNEADACGYALPSEASTCESVMSEVTYQASHIRLGQTMVAGDRAVVVQLGTMCVAQVCTTNVDPRSGLPTTSHGFDAAFGAPQTGSPDPDHDFVYSDGRWWAQF